MTDKLEPTDHDSAPVPAGRHAELEALLAEAREILSGRHPEGNHAGELSRALLASAEGLAADGYDRAALCGAQAAAQLEHRDERPPLLTAACSRIARLAARMGDDDELRAALRAALRTLKRRGVLTDQLRAELDELKAGAVARAAQRVEPPIDSAVRLPADARQRHEQLEELFVEVRDFMSGRRPEANDDGELSRALFEWTEGLAEEGDDLPALRCAQAAARIEDDEGRPDGVAAAQTWVARLAARMGDDGALRTARRALKRLGALTVELRAELDELKAGTCVAAPPAPAGPSACVHPQFGRGVVMRREGDKLCIQFEDGVVRTLLASFVQPA